VQQDWSFVPVDANLLIFEALDERSQVPGVSPVLFRGFSSCFDGVEKVALKTLGRELPPIPEEKVYGSPLSKIDLDALARHLVHDNALSSRVANDFEDSVEVISDSAQWGFLGTSSGDRDDALRAIADTKPVRWCCYDLTKQGTSTLILDTGPAGETTPMVVDLTTVGTPKIGRVALRKLTQAEAASAKERWPAPHTGAAQPLSAPVP
jgi:hypothetical protein